MDLDRNVHPFTQILGINTWWSLPKQQGQWSVWQTNKGQYLLTPAMVSVTHSQIEQDWQQYPNLSSHLHWPVVKDFGHWWLVDQWSNMKLQRDQGTSRLWQSGEQVCVIAHTRMRVLSSTVNSPGESIVIWVGCSYCYLKETRNKILDMSRYCD